jgi:outer membrane protein assembly factor BamB
MAWTKRSLGAAVVALMAACSEGDGPTAYDYGVPLAPDSPWPKFRRDAEQTGQSPLSARPGGDLWDFTTGAGVFSSPVVAGDGTIFVGSADRTFYALAPDGTLRWSFETGEIIDSSGLLDDAGRVVFGSGDGHLYALDAASGEEQWRFEADDPSVSGAFINWFEGNVAVGPAGDLYVPNDNFFVYAIDRDTGEARWRFQMPDQTWSLPAIDPATGRLYIGNNNLLSLLGDNTFAIDPDGAEVWATTTNGSVVASPLLTADGRVVVGGFDGFLRAYDAETGDQLWELGTRDHIYASPGILPDGTIVQPSADGTIYAVDPATGALRWAFDTREALRSSPAIDGEGAIYLGSGEGRLFVLEPDGTLRWSLRLIDDARNDLNASPALGETAIYIAGESGQVFSVPYDYCLGAEGESDERCTLGPAEDLPDDGAFLLYTDAAGGSLTEPPATIAANQILCFSLFVRERGDTTLALIDSDSVAVELTPPTDADVRVSGDRKFLTIVPRAPFAPDAEGRATVAITGQYLVDFDREGLAFSGGRVGGDFEASLAFELAPAGPASWPLPVPSEPGDPSGLWELTRLSAPLPTILPSYNQIGFDQLRYHVGLVEGEGDRAVAWFVGATLPEGEDTSVVDPASLVMVPFELTYAEGLLTLRNEEGMQLNVMNANIAFDSFVVAAAVDDAGESVALPQVHVETDCRGIAFYGAFLEQLGLCNPSSHLLTVFGTTLLRPHEGGVQDAPGGVGTVTFSAEAGAVTATIEGSTLLATEHLFGVLLIDAATGRPVTLDYVFDTERAAGAGGEIERVTLSFDPGQAPALVRAYLMVDAYPAARQELAIP